MIDKRKLGFFRGSAGSWLRAQLDAAIPAYLLRTNPRYAEMLDTGQVAALVEAQRSGKGSPQLLLGILMLEVWLSSTLPRALGRTPEPVDLAA